MNMCSTLCKPMYKLMKEKCINCFNKAIVRPVFPMSCVSLPLVPLFGPSCSCPRLSSLVHLSPALCY